MTASTFMTLTCRPSNYDSPEHAFRSMSVAFNHLIKRLRRLMPASPFGYFLVWELTKAGWPHIHVLMEAPFIPQSWLSKTWQDLTSAPIVDIRRVESKRQAISYVTKYMTKDPVVPPGMKTYRSSRQFLDRPPAPQLQAWTPGDHWHVVLTTLDNLTQYVATLGWKPERVNDDVYVFVCHPPEGVAVSLPFTAAQERLV